MVLDLFGQRFTKRPVGDMGIHPGPVYDMTGQISKFIDACNRQLPPNCRLFRYFSPERISVLETETLLVSPPACFNDPFEALPTIAQSNSFEIRREVEGYLERNPHGLELLPRRERRREMRKLVKTVSNKAKKELPQFYQRLTKQIQYDFPYGVICLSSSHVSLLMWSHYASSHTGFVLEFEPVSEHFKSLGLLDKVVYSDKRPQYPAFQLLPRPNDDGRNKDEIFRTKSREWSYEQEYRLFYPLALCEQRDTDQGKRYFTKLDKRCIKAVYLGCRSTDSLLSETCNLTAEVGIPIYKAKLSRDLFRIDFESVRRSANAS